MTRSLFRHLPSAATLGAALLLSACDLFTPQPPLKWHDKAAVIPETFLYTKYAPLNDWLDTPVKFQVFDTPLLEIFQHPALRTLNIHIVKAPKKNPRVTIDRIAITRRQLLWSLAQDHQFTMTAVFGGTDQPSRIEVRSREE